MKKGKTFVLLFSLFFFSFSYADDLDIFDKFDKEDKKTFNDLLDKAKGCIEEWDFECARSALRKAKKYITSKKDRYAISKMYGYLEEEEKRKEEQERRKYAERQAKKRVSLEYMGGNRYVATVNGHEYYISINYDNGENYYYFNITGWGGDPGCRYYPSYPKGLWCARCDNVTSRPHNVSLSEATVMAVKCAEFGNY